MKLNISQTENYVPSWNKNNKLPENEQIKIIYERLSGDHTSSLLRITGDGADFDYMTVLKNSIIEIENLEINNKKIKTGKQLLECKGLYSLCFETAMHIISDSKLSEELGKKN